MSFGYNEFMDTAEQQEEKLIQMEKNKNEVKIGES